MKKLGILVNQVERDELRIKSDVRPLVAFSYARSGLIRLAGLKKLKK
ncbi:hypothetical protein SAMN02745216_03216 [Desulfatibacillum alkenivorans DSM 16219]|jgi:hypothetical protein|uniref:Uncharacterized protein n=1 Tax=Desulfatibacillum alkenivorans DSM 16219 TaxID=1121393 RepID=A0A1M6R827_9BACT|nr:hypothetical protein [Desulfatibacillum alkenivorans]SHK28602.1 hypothetical protein SAMN02745216_03216 [Desulfatibacillum alkenivorans DSM 16219]